MNKLNKTLDVLVNIAILVAAGGVITMVVRSHGSPQPASASSLEGKKLTLDLSGPDQGRGTLLMALSTKCHFCKEAAPLYKRMAEAAKKKSLKVAAVLSQDADEGRKYVEELGLPVDQVRQEQPKKLGMRGTPTVLLLDGNGVVKREWAGMPPPEVQNRVFEEFQGLIQ